jgi:maltooligosyltrehalose trehalohydrolase
MNFDGPESGPVREFYISNAGYWIDEYHLDGLRLDATQNIYDSSEEHILTAIARRVRKAAGERHTLLVGENEPQNTTLLLPPEEGGSGLDALWNDDFHHAAVVAMTGHNEAYYTDYRGTPQELVSAVKYGFLYQGQWYLWQKKWRGTPTYGIPAPAFIIFIQNHDQVANSFRGVRVHEVTSPGRYKALSALMLLAPNTPMLFMGQEFAASTPFLYFADHEDELAKLVYKGRSEFLKQFRSLNCPEIDFSRNDPANPETFIRSKLDFTDRERHPEIFTMYRELLRLRREDPVFSTQRADRLDGAVLAEEAFVLRWFGGKAGDRLLVINLGRDLQLCPVPEPLLAPPRGMCWDVIWSSEDPGYGGCGTPPLEAGDEGWRISGHAAVVLHPVPREEGRG